MPTSATQATILQGQSGRGPNGLATHFSAFLSCISTESCVNLVSILFSSESTLVSALVGLISDFSRRDCQAGFSSSTNSLFASSLCCRVS